MLSTLDALERLREGNRRFVAGDHSADGARLRARRDELVAGQEPFAIVVGCSDSRVPVEMVFDQGLGDLFVIRVAGNIVSPSQAASVEFAVEKLGTRLVVVLGHTRCGAVLAAVEEVETHNEDLAIDLRPIVDHIRPAVDQVATTDLRNDPRALARLAVRANVRASIQDLLRVSPRLDERSREGDLLVVGAEYALESGVVDFFFGTPSTG